MRIRLIAVLLVAIMVVAISSASISEAKGHGGAHTKHFKTPEEEVLYLLDTFKERNETYLSVLAIHLPDKVGKIDKLSPWMKQVLLGHVIDLREGIQDATSPDSVGQMARALLFYRKLLSINDDGILQEVFFKIEKMKEEALESSQEVKAEIKECENSPEKNWAWIRFWESGCSPKQMLNLKEREQHLEKQLEKIKKEELSLFSADK